MAFCRYINSQRLCTVEESDPHLFFDESFEVVQLIFQYMDTYAFWVAMLIHVC